MSCIQVPGELRPVPPALLAVLADVEDRVSDPGTAALFRSCFTSTWSTTMHHQPDGTTFVVTGDIPAMWLRDSAAQVRPYLVAASDPEVGAALVGVLRRQVRAVLLDPYANAFNAGPFGHHADPFDVPVPNPDVWERKYEVDSLCAPLQLAYALWTATGRTDHLDDELRAAARSIVALWRREQDHAGSDYRFLRTDGPFAGDSLPGGGHGGPVARTGMTWSGFRPSDDACTFGYLVPSNAMAAVSLTGLVELAHGPLADPELAADAAELGAEIATGVDAARTADGILPYETDGLGHHVLMDDANVPSLLSLPYLGWCATDDPDYLATRRLLLSERNPFWFAGGHAAGIGSPHTPTGWVWPIALAMEGLTSGTAEGRAAALAVLGRTHDGTGLMHESFDVDAPAKYTRPWVRLGQRPLRRAGAGDGGPRPLGALPPLLAHHDAAQPLRRQRSPQPDADCDALRERRSTRPQRRAGRQSRHGAPAAITAARCPRDHRTRTTTQVRRCARCGGGDQVADHRDDHHARNLAQVGRCSALPP